MEELAWKDFCRPCEVEVEEAFEDADQLDVYLVGLGVIDGAASDKGDARGRAWSEDGGVDDIANMNSPGPLNQGRDGKHGPEVYFWKILIIWG